MKKRLTGQLAAMRSLSDKAMFRDILENLFLELTEHYDKLHTDLEARIRNELPPPLERFTIVTGVARREGFDPEHNFLRPMMEGEESARPTAAAVREALVRDGAYKAETVFLAADYLRCRALSRERERDFPGAILSGEKRTPARFRLRPAERYLAPVANLFRLFHANQLPWQTVNAPYLTKFFDLILVGDGSDDIPEGELRFEVDAENDLGLLRYGLMPVWNVARFQAQGDEFPAPVIDTLNYEYRFNLTRLGLDNGYLADGAQASLLETRLEPEAMVVVSPERQDFHWDIYMVARLRENKTDDFPYPLMSNRQTDSFAARLAGHYGATIRTKAELFRLFQSYEAAAGLRFLDLALTGERGGGAKEEETYEMNPFLRDEVRNPAGKRTLLLRFTASQQEDILNRDIMSFLASQAALWYPEYHCVGELV